jgi:hypothetical protein
MPSYLVESYVPQSPDGVEGVAAQARRAADLASGNGVVRYVRTTLLPADETCFHAFDATSLEELEAALARVGLVADRIVQSDETPAADTATTEPFPRNERSTT